MNKQETIIEIMNLYDENERLKNEIEIMKHYQNASNSGQCNNEKCINNIDYLMIEAGKKQILDKVLSYWKEVTVNYDEDNDIYKCQSYSSWLDKVIQKSRIPDEMSLDEFRVYFRKELQEIYEKEKTKALNEAKGIENVEEE